jgi:putative transcriptional regulator
MPKRGDYLEQMRRQDAAQQRRVHQQMLRDWDAARAALPEVDGEFIKQTRQKLKCSRPLFARRLFMNERTLEKWEQGRCKPNGHAAVLLLLVRHFPDTLERLRRIANPDKQNIRQMQRK